MSKELLEMAMNLSSALRVASVGVSLTGSVATAQIIDLPPRRPGLWELSMKVEKPSRMAPISTRMCIDAATDREAMDFALRMSKSNCARHDVRKTGAIWVIDAECTFGPIKSATKTTIAGDFQSAVTIRMEGTTEGGFAGEQGPQPTLITQTATWKAADCGDLKPGEMGMAGGIKFNIKQLKSLPGLTGAK